jgi:outer membrane protein OmpA-like peptidoglycan-associated protein
MQSGKRTILTVTLILSLCGAARMAAAQESVEGGTGLIFIDKAVTPLHGGFSLGAFYFTEDVGDVKPESNFTNYGLTASAGLFDKIELSLAVPFGTIKPQHISGDGWREQAHGGETVSGAFDGLFKAKYNFISTEGGFRYAVIGALTLPFGNKDKELGSGKTDPGIGFVVDKEYDEITWHFMGVYMNYSGKDQDPAINYGAGFEWFVHDHDVSAVAEVSGRAWSKQILHRTDNTKQSFAVRYHFGHPGESSILGSAYVGYSSWGGGAGEASPNHLAAVGITLEFGAVRKHGAREHVPGEEHGGAGAGEGDKGAGAGDKGAGAGEGDKGAGAGDKGAGAGGADRILVGLKPVHFMFDSADLNGEAVASLKDNAKVFTDNPMAKVIVEGHACSIGPKGYNQDLGLKRAKAVKKFLVKELGVNTDKIFVVMSQGEDKPAESNTTNAGRAANRRVEFLGNK